MSVTDERLTAGPSQPPPRTGRRRLLVALATLLSIVLVVLMVGFFVNLPYYALSPGIAQPVAPLITLPSARSHPVHDTILLTDVLVSPVRLVDLVPDLLGAHTALVRQSEILGNTPPAQYNQVNQLAMTESQEAASVAALRRLGYPVTETDEGVLVATVVPGSAADRAGITVGDTILAIGSHATPDVTALLSALTSYHVDDRIPVQVRSGAQTRTVQVTVTSTSRQGRALLGVAVSTEAHFDLPFPVKVDSDGIGGPSAGLAFTLGIIDRLTSGDITGGSKVAATGTIDTDGNVGDVGGVAQKTVAVENAGARIFFVPPPEAAVARANAVASLTIVPVTTLDQALSYLGRHGGDLRGIPVAGRGT